MRTELSALRHAQVWLTLLIGTIGFGGMFATYSYITPTMTTLAGISATAVTGLLAVYGRRHDGRGRCSAVGWPTGR